MPISGRSASFPHWILNDLTLFLIENRKETLLCQINPEEMIHATAEAAKSIKIAARERTIPLLCRKAE